MNKIGQPTIEGGEYVHGIFCSGSRRYPRTPGNSCSCHSVDLYYNRLRIERKDGDAKRTLFISECLTCFGRIEYVNDPPKEHFCQTCDIWVPVVEVSWEGMDFAKLLPSIPR